jgi:hypothetical protein
MKVTKFRLLIGKTFEENRVSVKQTRLQPLAQVLVVIHKSSYNNARHTGDTVFATSPPLVEAMGSATSSIFPERDLLDLHGRVAIVTGAKYVIPGIAAVLCLR